MKKTLLILALLSSPAFGAVNIITNPPPMSGPPMTTQSTHKEYAKILSVSPINNVVNTPVQQCYHPQPSPNGGMPMLFGALVGGAVGNQIGSGNGRAIATGVGAAIGSQMGRDYQEAKERSRSHCTTTYYQQVMADGYMVTLNHNGRVFTLKMHSPPPVGSLVPVNINISATY